MKKNGILFCVLALFAMLFTFSCKKDKSKMDLLTQKAWKPTSYKDNGVEVIENCDKDDVITFTSTGSSGVYVGSFNVGADDCSGDEISGSFSWSLTANETKLVLDSDTASISTLNDNSLVLNYSDGWVETYGH